MSKATDVVAVAVPAMAGDIKHPAAEGPRRLAHVLLETGMVDEVVEVATETDHARDARSASLQIGRRVTRAVREARDRARRPLVLSGSCDVAPAVLAGLGEPECGVVWIDAHADFNTPETSVTGFWPGMTLAVVVGDCCAEVWTAVGGHPVPPDRVVLIGTRALSPEAEGRRLGASSLSVARWRDGRPTAEVDALLDDLQKRASDVYVHLDVDALDPHAGPGVADPPVPGGLTADQLVHTLEAIITRFTVAGATVATFTPSHDDGRTLRAALRAVERLTCARAPRRPRSTSGRSADRP